MGCIGCNVVPPTRTAIGSAVTIRLITVYFYMISPRYGIPLIIQFSGARTGPFPDINTVGCSHIACQRQNSH